MDRRARPRSSCWNPLPPSRPSGANPLPQTRAHRLAPADSSRGTQPPGPANDCGRRFPDVAPGASCHRPDRTWRPGTRPVAQADRPGTQGSGGAAIQEPRKSRTMAWLYGPASRKPVNWGTLEDLSLVTQSIVVEPASRHPRLMPMGSVRVFS